MKLLIKSAKVIDNAGRYHQKTLDILIENGKIKKIAKTINDADADEISFENLHISKAWFDSSVCFGEPGYEERETLKNGLLTAAKSGFSAIALNPDTDPVTDHKGLVEFLIQNAKSTPSKLYPIGALTKQSQGDELSEIYDMIQAGAVAFGDYKQPVHNPNLLKIALEYAQACDALIQVFPNDDRLTKQAVMNEGETSTKLGLKGMPAFAEEIQIDRDLKILEYTGGKLHIPTISTQKAVELIKEAKDKGLDVTCSVAIHNLYFNDEVLSEFDATYKVNPPLRNEVQRKALINAVEEGVIDFVTSDHRPMDIEHKKMELEHAEFGSLGLESAFATLNTLFGTEKTIELLNKGRKRFNIPIPEIKEGAVAELCLFDPSKKIEFKENHIYSTSKNSMFIGEELKGEVYGIIADDQIIINEL